MVKVKEGVNGKKTISLLTHGLILSKERPREGNERVVYDQLKVTTSYLG